MPKRFIFKKIVDSGESGTCYYCKGKTLFALYDEKDGSEVFSCPSCALKISKERAKGIRKYRDTLLNKERKSFLETKSLIKNRENDELEGEIDGIN